MSRPPKALAERLAIARRFVRSVNLERDFAAASQNGDYIVTPTARAALWRLGDGAREESPNKAWTLTGPYGVGKSAFAVFLTRLLGPDRGQRDQGRRQLAGVDPALAQRLTELKLIGPRSRPFLPVLATARRTSASRCLAEGLVGAVTAKSDRGLRSAVRNLRGSLDSVRNGEPWDTRQVVDAHLSLARAARAAGYEGLLLVVDELGKLFEYAARYPHKSDLYVLQELAEQAARHREGTILFVGLLHQAFEEYGQHLDLATRREWAKIQGRFEDIAFLEPAEQVIRMVADAIRWLPDRGDQELHKTLDVVAAQAADAGATPPSMGKTDFQAIARAAYPLHPVALVALPFLFRRFAQNERSLFSYLSSLEPFGFQEFVKTHVLTPEAVPFVRPADLFDYLTKNLGAGLYRQPHALRWLETADVLERREDLTPLQRQLVKTIGILSALGEFCHLRASKELILGSVCEHATSTPEIEAALEALVEASILTYRKFNHTYRIWEGSDIDIEERIAEGERKVRHGLNLAERVVEYLPQRPMVARRHSFETGALRFFGVRYVDSPDRLFDHANPRGADGEVVVCLAESPSVGDRFRELAIGAREPLSAVYAIPQQLGELRGAVTELGALRWVWENTPELRDDRVARREVAVRIADAEQMVQRNLQGLLDPREEPLGSACLWIHGGKESKVNSPRDVSRLLSDVCDEVFRSTPKIRNELVARRILSSAAAAARRNLVERMWTRQGESALGIGGYPPERSMYESVLRATGLHRQDEAGRWAFLSPPEEDPAGVTRVWEFLSTEVLNRQPEPVPLEGLFAKLASPPFGVPAGLHPVLLCAFLLAHPDETTLYREGTFLPEPGVADLEILMRRPDMYAIAGSRVKGARALGSIHK